MTHVALEDMGLPACPPCEWMAQVEALGWEGGGLYQPGERDIMLWYREDRRAFAIVSDVHWSDPVTFALREGSPAELAAWVEENRPEWVTTEPPNGEIPCNSWRAYRDVREYADDPEALEKWWQLCDDVEAGRRGLVVDVGDA